MENERKREQNWSVREKDCLRELVNMHVHTIENKQNDLRMIKRKKNAWEAIRLDIRAAGFDRDVLRMNQQWVRMKMGAKKAIAHVRRATAATGNIVEIPVLDEGDLHIQSMISAEMEEDTILIDSDTILPSCSPSSPCPPPACSPTPPCLPLSAGHDQSEALVTRLRNLPKKTATKTDVMRERQHQISKESSYSEELHLLRVENLKAESRKRMREEEQSEELHSLKVKLLLLQILNEKRKQM